MFLLVRLIEGVDEDGEEEVNCDANVDKTSAGTVEAATCLCCRPGENGSIFFVCSDLLSFFRS